MSAQRQAASGCGGKGTPQDAKFHGAHCAGIIGAVAGNGYGVAGIAPNVKLMCPKVSDFRQTFCTAHVLKACDYTLRMGAHVAACSFGPEKPNTSPCGRQRSEMVNETACYAAAMKPWQDKNMLVVAAAGASGALTHSAWPGMFSHMQATVR